MTLLQLKYIVKIVECGSMNEASHELYADLSGKNPNFRKVWDSYRPYRDSLYTWFRVAEASFDSFAFTAAQTVR